MAEEPTAPEGDRPFWSFSTCCGCFAIVVFVFICLMAGGLLYSLNQFFPSDPVVTDKPVFSAEQFAEARRKELALERGETVRLTPDEFTILVQSQIARTNWGEDAVFRAEAQPDGSVRFRFSNRIDDWSWPVRGRYVNFDVSALSGAIERATPEKLELRVHRYGGNADVTITIEHKDLAEQQPPWTSDDRLLHAFDRLERLRIDAGQIEVKWTPPQVEAEPPAEAPK